MKMSLSTKPVSNRKWRGFTLIELLVVILILAILAALVVPRFIGRADDAKRAKAIADIATLSGELEKFRLDCDRYPTTEEGLNALRVQPADIKGWRGPYITYSVPPDPWGFEYFYEYPGANGDDSFALMSYGQDGQPGGSGNAADVMQGGSDQQQQQQPIQ